MGTTVGSTTTTGVEMAGMLVDLEMLLVVRGVSALLLVVRGDSALLLLGVLLVVFVRGVSAQVVVFGVSAMAIDSTSMERS